jgi:hypothetical protein
MNEKKLSKLQKEYRKFFLEKLSFYEVKSPADLTKEKKSVFFNSVQDMIKTTLTKVAFS